MSFIDELGGKEKENKALPWALVVIIVDINVAPIVNLNVESLGVNP